LEKVHSKEKGENETLEDEIERMNLEVKRKLN
jgi:hypothetical protein